MPSSNPRKSTTRTIATSLLVISISAIVLNELRKSKSSAARPNPAAARRPSRRERAQREAESWRSEREAEIEASRTSLYKQPRRALSSPLLLHTYSDRPRRDLSQAQSILFRLPAELRNVIYEMVLGPPLRDGGLFRLRQAYDGSPKLKHYYFEPGAPWAEDRLLDLPLACRKIYTETIPLLYTLPSFYFSLGTNEHALSRFTSLTLPARLAAVRHLHLWYLLPKPEPEPHIPMPTPLYEALRQIVHFPHLRRLDVILTIKRGATEFPEARKMQIRRALEAVGEERGYWEHVGSMGVDVPWDRTEVPVPAGPFKVRARSWWLVMAAR